MEDFLTYLNKLVSFSSVNNPIENAKPSRDILDYINDQILAPLDYETLFYEGNGYWSLLSYIPRLKPTILFIGHCDVVPPGPKWETDPFQLTIRDDKAYGRGSADMKGAVAVMLSLAEFFKNNGTASIVYAINLDEESGGSFGAGQLLPILKEKNLVPDYVINGDANGLQIINRRRNPYVITFNLKKCVEEIRGRKNSETFRTKIVDDRTMHAAYFNNQMDVHCADLASQFLVKNDYKAQKITGVFVKNNVLPSEITLDYIIPDRTSEEVHKYDENLTRFLLAVSNLKNVEIPSDYSDYGINLTFNYYREERESHMCQLDLRIMSSDHEVIHQYFENFSKKYLIESEVVSKGSIGPVNTPIDSKLVKTSVEVAEKMKLFSTPLEMGGATDSRWFSANNIPAIEFGPLGGNVHGSNEFVEIGSLEVVRTFYKLLYQSLHG